MGVGGTTNFGISGNVGEDCGRALFRGGATTVKFGRFGCGVEEGSRDSSSRFRLFGG